MEAAEQTAPVGTGILIILLAVLASVTFILFAGFEESDWLLAARSGWLLSGVLGLLGLLSVRRAFSVAPAAAMRVVFGGMLLRLLVAGTLAGLVIGLRWLDPVGFVAGLMFGVVVFQFIEIGGIFSAARKWPRSPRTEGATEHGI